MSRPLPRARQVVALGLTAVVAAGCSALTIPPSERTSAPASTSDATPPPATSPTQTAAPSSAPATSAAPTSAAPTTPGTVPPPEPAPTATTTITLAQVGEHETVASCWTAIDGKVYDLTPWMDQHPGGAQAIATLCGVDGTSQFTPQHGKEGPAGGPQRALRDLQIGVLPAEPTNSPVTMAQVATHDSPRSCWTAIDGKVYNLTAWLTKHPGGPSPVHSLCGVDGTKAFRGKHGPSGSDALPQKMLATLQVGVVASTSSASTRAIPMSQVNAHNAAASCWVVVDGGVYDVTQWLAKHPGGADPIMRLCGTDATAAFTGKHGAAGPDGIPQKALASLRIGGLAR